MLMHEVDWNDNEVKNKLRVIKMYLTGLDGQEGGICEITSKVLPNFGDDYLLISDVWNDRCPNRAGRFLDKHFLESLLTGENEAIAELENAAREFYCVVMNFAEEAKEMIREKKTEVNQYSWIGYSYDGCYKAKSEHTFATCEECYNDMREAALEKMKWNTEYAEDFHDGIAIGYRVQFHPLHILHESYSGVYHWKMCENGKQMDETRKMSHVSVK